MLCIGYETHHFFFLFDVFWDNAFYLFFFWLTWAFIFTWWRQDVVFRLLFFFLFFISFIRTQSFFHRFDQWILLITALSTNLFGQSQYLCLRWFCQRLILIFAMSPRNPRALCSSLTIISVVVCSVFICYNLLCFIVMIRIVVFIVFI